MFKIICIVAVAALLIVARILAYVSNWNRYEQHKK